MVHLPCFRCTAGASVIHTQILFLRLSSIIGYYKVLAIVPCAIWYTFVACCISAISFKLEI